ncbi:MAG: hypothetical protein GXP28_01885 [Planctomycetes bacterium]|nr:hypothetical protein [Planctomycetota bacterium]
MFFSPRIRLKSLAQLCYRLATATGAGIEDRKVWRAEAARGSRSQQRKISCVADELAKGQSIPDALRTTGKFFPPLFRQMVEVGEIGGRLDRTYGRLATHYERTLKVRRDFMGRLAWPLLQFSMALGIVGLLIWIMGMLPANTGPKGVQADILGLGLIGTRGLVIYVNILIVLGIALLLLMEVLRRGIGWTRSLQRMALRIPVIGGALKTLALSRFTWALQLVLDTPMDLRRALPLALEATGNDYYACEGPGVALRIEQGQSLHAALTAAGVFPVDLLDSIHVGEESGRLVETMERQSSEYQERAGIAISILAQAAGYLVWVLVAAMIIMMIFRIFSFYVGTINSFL